MRIIKILPSDRWPGFWESYECDGVEPAYRKKEDAIGYASQRFGGSRGEVHVYDATGATIERMIIVDGRGQYQKVKE
jgi:hypothetical protein